MSILDTLSNIGVGGLSGFGDSYQQRGWYMPQFNYAGNGLAKNSMSYFANPNYRDYTSGGRALSSLFGNDKDNGEKLTFGQMKERLNTALSKPMFSNLLDRNQPAMYSLKTETINMPQVGNVGGGTIGDYGNAYNSFYSYNLPTQQTNFKKFWE